MLSTEQSLPSAHKIAQAMSTREYFLTEESKLLDEWQTKSKNLFRNTGQVLKKEYQLKSVNMVEQYGNEYDDLYDRSRKQFEAYCILNRKVQKKGDQIENFASFFNKKNHQKSFFNAWKQTTLKNKYLRRMDEKSQAYKTTRTLRTCLKQWNKVSMNNIKSKIKSDVLQKTEIEITTIQSEYERLIKSLEQNLEKKLLELQKEQEQHKILHDKYQNMVGRGKIENV